MGLWEFLKISLFGCIACQRALVSCKIFTTWLATLQPQQLKQQKVVRQRGKFRASVASGWQIGWHLYFMMAELRAILEWCCAVDYGHRTLLSLSFMAFTAMLSTLRIAKARIVSLSFTATSVSHVVLILRFQLLDCLIADPLLGFGYLLAAVSWFVRSVVPSFGQQSCITAAGAVVLRIFVLHRT